MSGLLDTVGDLLGGGDNQAPAPTTRRTTTDAAAARPTGGQGIVPVLLPGLNESSSSATGGRRTTASSAAAATSSAQPAATGSASSPSAAAPTVTSASDESTSSEVLSATPLPTDPTSIESIIPTFETSTTGIPEATPPAPDSTPQAQVSGGGMDQKTTMAIAISAPVAAVTLIGLGVLIWWTRRRKAQRKREDMPYDDEFETLKSKHERKFGVGHNY